MLKNSVSHKFKIDRRTEVLSLSEGFTLVELLVVIVILAILGVVGMTVYTSVSDRAEDARRKADVAQIAKAFEANYNPLAGYTMINDSHFASGAIPVPPEGGSYFTDVELGGGFRVCSAISGGTNPCSANSETCYCKDSNQVTYVAPSPSPSGSPAPSPSPSPASTLATGLVGYWKMDEASWVNNCSTLSVLDYTTTFNGRACPNSTGPTGGAAGRSGFGNAGSFDGNDYVEIADNNAFSANTTNELTVAAWINPSSGGANRDIIVKGSGGNYEWSIRQNSSNQFQAVVYNSGGSTIGVINTPAFTVGTWNHIVMILNFTTNNLHVYRNGALASTGSISGTYTNGTSTVRFGMRSDNLNPYSGLIDEVRVYNRVLTMSEISEIYDLTAPSP